MFSQDEDIGKYSEVGDILVFLNDFTKFFLTKSWLTGHKLRKCVRGYGGVTTWTIEPVLLTLNKEE